jgi:hypothetical protein
MKRELRKARTGQREQGGWDRTVRTRHLELDYQDRTGRTEGGQDRTDRGPWIGQPGQLTAGEA